MSTREAGRRGLALALCACQIACAPLPQLTSGTDLTIKLPDQLPSHRQTSVEVSRPSEANVARGAGVGAGGVLGASAGLAASAACGFMIIVCAPIFMLAGGATGVGAAGIVEAAAQDRDAVKEPDRRWVDLDRRLVAFAQANELDEQFRRVLVDRASAHWRVVPASTRNSLTVRLAGFALRAESEERIALEVSVAVRMDSEDALSATASRGPVVLQGEFRHQGSTAHIEQWMDESGDFLRSEVARAYESIAQQIVNALTGRTLG